MTLRILREPAVENKVGLKRSSIYEQMAAGTFPKPVQLGPKSVGWLESEIDQWIEKRAKLPRGPFRPAWRRALPNDGGAA
jgi:prophage regulatory protein